MAVAGCGDDDATAERDVRAAASQFRRSIAARDYRQVCRLVTPQVKADWERFAERNPKLFSTAGCPAFARDFYGSPRGTLRRDLAKLDRASVRIDGDTATIKAHPRDRRAGTDETTELKRVDGRWLLDD
jgi:hypothetical protein